MSKSKFIHTLSESKNIFALEQKAIVLSFVKNVAFFLGHVVVGSTAYDDRGSHFKSPFSLSKNNDLKRQKETKQLKPSVSSNVSFHLFK